LSSTTEIRRLTLRGVAEDAAATRLRASRQLAGADLRPAGLPPAAVLVVRRVRDPVPGSVGGDGLRAPPDWEGAVRNDLTAAARMAARPDQTGRVPATAEAVLFDDQAQLLASMLCELAAGDVASRWWLWAALPRFDGTAVQRLMGGDPAPLLVANPRPLPTVLRWLVRWRAAAAVAAHLGSDDAHRTLSALVEAHGLPRQLASRPSAPDHQPVAGPLKIERQPGPTAALDPSPTTSSRRTAPWRGWLPTELGDGRLPAAVEQLFGIGIGLSAVPQLIRTTGFAEATRAWCRAATRMSPAPAENRPWTWNEAADSEFRFDDTSTNTASTNLGTFPSIDATQVGHDMPSLPPQRVSVDRTDLDPPVRATADPKPDLSISSDLGNDREAAQLAREPNRRPLEDPGSRGSVAERPPELGCDPGDEDRASLVPTDGHTGAAEQAPSPAEPDSQLWTAAERIVTTLGGVLYLIHVLDELGLPGCFEEGWRLDTVAGPWGTLDLVARGLLGRRFHDLADDPLWEALSRLAAWPDRSQAEPAEDPPFRLPVGWPGRLEDGAPGWRWAAARGRLRLWTRTGYMVADIARTASPPSVQARTEIHRFPRLGSGATHVLRRSFESAPLAKRPQLPTGCPKYLGRWLEAVVPAVRQRLRLALGEADEAVETLLTVPATLWLGSSHLDLVLDIEKVNLAARRAGLDRDPGWLPSHGRVVQFHFN